MSNLKVFFPVGHNFCKFHFLQENTLPCFQTGVMSGSRSEKVMGWGGEGPLIHFFLPQKEKKLCNHGGRGGGEGGGGVGHSQTNVLPTRVQTPQTMDPKWRITAHQICTPKWRHTCKT